MRGHNVCFCLEIRKIIFELSSIHLLVWSSDSGGQPGQNPNQTFTGDTSKDNHSPDIKHSDWSQFVIIIAPLFSEL